MDLFALFLQKVVCEGLDGANEFEKVFCLLFHFLWGDILGFPPKGTTKIDFLCVSLSLSNIFLLAILGAGNHQDHASTSFNTSKKLACPLEGLVCEISKRVTSLKKKDGVYLIWSLELSNRPLITFKVYNFKVVATTNKLFHNHFTNLVICVSASCVPKAYGIYNLHSVINIIVNIIDVKLVCADFCRG